MIDQAMKFIQREMNNYLASGSLPHDERVVLANLATPDGGPPGGIAQHLVLSMVNLEREAAVGAPSFVGRAGNGGYTRTQQALHLNIYVLLSASYPGDYAGALRALSDAMTFLQGKPAYDSQNSADFPAAIQMLSMEFVSLSLSELSNMWALLGADFLPSAMYKLRMISLNADWTVAPLARIDKPAPTLGGLG